MLLAMAGLRLWMDTGKELNKSFHHMRSDSNFEVLMARYQQGDFDAASALVELISPQLYRFFASQMASRAEAEDLLQETWLRIHKVRHTYRPIEPLLPWFYAIARHIRVDHYRKAARTSLREQQLEVLEDAVAQPTQEAGIDQVAALLAPLSESQREVLAMLKVEGMTLEEVARATSSTIGSVKQKVHRAYKKLRGKALTLEGRKEPSEKLS